MIIEAIRLTGCPELSRDVRDFSHCRPGYNFKSMGVINQSRWFPPQTPLHRIECSEAVGL